MLELVGDWHLWLSCELTLSINFNKLSEAVSDATPSFEVSYLRFSISA